MSYELRNLIFTLFYQQNNLVSLPAKKFGADFLTDVVFLFPNRERIVCKNNQISVITISLLRHRYYPLLSNELGQST